ncbi:MAG: sensor histidine kinase [Bacteroidaceae bacterium]
MISRLRKIGQNSIITVFLHLIAWTVIFFIPPVFVFWSTGEQAVVYQLRMLNGPLTLALIFYINYLVLCPRLIDKRLSMRNFIILNLMLYLLGLGMMHLWRNILDACFPIISEDPHLPDGKHIHDATLWQKILLNLRDCILYFFITILAFLLLTSIKWQEAELAREKAERENANAHLRILKLQVSPHFLLNTLNNIYALIDINTEKAKDTVLNLSRMLGHMLYNEDDLYSSLHTEIELLKNYIALMRIRYDDTLEINTDIDEVVGDKIRCVNLVALTLLENAFKHGVVPNCKCRIDISIHADMDTGGTTLSIRNTNHPKSPSDLSGHGLGLKQVKERLELAYPDQYTWERGIGKDGLYFSTITITPKKT